jgi:magnesium and cobalt transporter
MNSNKQQIETEHATNIWHRFKRFFSASPKTTEDMVAMLDAANQNEVIDSDAKRIIEGALEVAEKHAREIMIPRTQMSVLKVGDSFADNLNKIIGTGHSRYPVIGENIDEVIGILLTKDLLGIIADGHSPPAAEANGDPIRDLLRPAVFVPESKRLNILLRQFRQDRNHMALVIDEYGSLAGLVTIEDVLEEIVGEIEDEHDNEVAQFIRKISDTRYIINALTPIEEFNETLHTKLSDEEFDTIGGIIVNQFGHVPKRNEKISFNGLTFHVVQADNRRLRMLRLTLDSSE